MSNRQVKANFKNTLTLNKKGKEVRARKQKEAEKISAEVTKERKRLEHL